MRFAVHQPNYAPWCGYFAKMAAVDVFVVLNDVQMPQGRSYVSRTRIRSDDDAQWLTVPVRRRSGEAIADVTFADADWGEQHLRTLRARYGRARAFEETFDLLAPLYATPGESLAAFNLRWIETVREHLGIDVETVPSSRFGISARADERIVEIGHRLGAKTYVSGAGGSAYQRPELFSDAGIQLVVKEYRPIPYPQAGGTFVGGLSIVDALFHLGRDARDVLSYPEAKR